MSEKIDIVSAADKQQNMIIRRPDSAQNVFLSFCVTLLVVKVLLPTRAAGLRVIKLASGLGRAQRALICLFVFSVSGVSMADSSAAGNDPWAEITATAADSVVSLQLSYLRNFDGTEQGDGSATGFIVDAEQGIILTNRHVVGAGPVRLSATFQNQEEVDALPLYRDPIHDFAFIRYDPKALEYAKPKSLELRPEKIRTGLNIRVIGSDGGEQLSILTGTIARLDRAVPQYARYGYNDFNTFYIQAASSTSGGSSGSPVIDNDGHVVALNAAANTKTASSFFLPLPRIQHALERLRTQQKIDRGSLQSIFSHESFRDLARLGLDIETEKRAREIDPDTNGMLMVDQVIAGGVSDNVLEEGDILISINKQIMTNFIDLEALLDDSVGQSLNLQVIRQGQVLELESGVADLHEIEPVDFLELGDALLQDMSIQHSRAMDLEQSGVVVMRAGYLFNRAELPQQSVIVEMDGKPVANLDDFINIVKASDRSKKLLTRFVVPGREYTTSLTQIDLDNRWFDFRRCSRVDDARFWDCAAVELPEKMASVVDDSVKVPQFRDELLNKVTPAMVRVDFNIPYTADNVYARNFKGIGIVVDKQNGIVAVDRNTVPIGLGDAEITFFGSQMLDAEVVFLNPRHNIALLQYDPKALGEVEFEELALAQSDGQIPEKLTMVGYRADGTFRRHEVDDFSRLTIGLSPPGLPRFQQSPIDLYGVPSVPPSLGGPFVDENGVVHAVYMSFAYEDGREIHQSEWAMPASVISETLRMYQSDGAYYSLDVRLVYRSISDARQLGLPQEWLEKYIALPSANRKVLYVEQVVPDTDATEKLLPGDIILAIDGELVADLLQAEIMSQQASVELSLLRAGKVIEVSLQPTVLGGVGTDRLVSWAGAHFQEPHHEIGYMKGVNFPGVYVAATEQGSPALWDGLFRNRFVTHIDGEPVENLDDLLALVSNIEQDTTTRLSLVSISGRKRIVTVSPEYNFWPTFEVKRSEAGWARINHDAP